MRAGVEILRDPERALRREWLHADGRGGWAAQTLLGAHTRREHGLLVVQPPPARVPLVLLARLEEALTLGGRRFELSTNLYPDTVHPRGFEHLASVALDPLPTAVYELPGGARLTRVLARAWGRPGLALLYSLDADETAELELRPLLAYREAGALQHENDYLRPRSWDEGGDVACAPYADSPTLYLRAAPGEWAADGLWYRSFDYPREREAGREFREDLLSPGVFRCRLSPERPVEVLAWAGPIPAATGARGLIEDEKRRLRGLRGDGEGLAGDLRQAADALVLQQDGEPAILGAFPPRPASTSESLRALPGLLFETERWDEARRLLSLALARLSDPSAVSPAEVAEDAPLWCAVAIARWLQAGGDPQVPQGDWREPLFALLDAYLSGAMPGRAVAPPGLLAEVKEDCDLRLRVDTQALWYNALLLGAELAREAGDARRSPEWTQLAARVREAVLRNFWSEERGHLADEVGPDETLFTVGPHQILAVVLPHALLPRDKSLRLLDRAQELLTPLGLRATAEAEGGRAHPGLAAWYFEARIRVSGEEGKRAARAWLRDFGQHLAGQGHWGVAEAYAAEAPHEPLGAWLHAPSVADLLRLDARAGRELARLFPRR